MRCPKCGGENTRVIDSRMQEVTNAIKRRRECRTCGHRFTTFERCEDPIEVDDIELELRSRTVRAVSSHEIGDMVLKRLANLDKVAYIRFASVYRDFKDVEEFFNELDKLR